MMMQKSTLFVVSPVKNFKMYFRAQEILTIKRRSVQARCRRAWLSLFLSFHRGEFMVQYYLSVLLVFAVSTATAAAPRHGFSSEQLAEMVQHNENLASHHILEGLTSSFKKLTKSAQTPVTPFAEFTNTGYLIFNDRSDFTSWPAKTGMAANLPPGVTLVVFTGNANKSHQNQLRSTFSQWVDSSRVKILFAPQGEKGFWARDSVPIPVWKGSGLQVVDARYYHNFEGDSYFADAFSAKLDKHDYYYEGGNFLPNSRGECIVVNNDGTKIIPDSIFTQKYGCSKLVRLPFIKGIGHVDESVKFVNDTTVITDSDTYRKLLSPYYTVVMMPRPDREYETYVNSLIINGTVYVPVFGEKNDQKALKVYTDLGFKAVPLNSTDLSNEGMGSIHCITMTYPPVPLKEVAAQLNAVEVL